MCQCVYEGEGDGERDVVTVNMSMCQHVNESVRRIRTGSVVGSWKLNLRGM